MENLKHLLIIFLVLAMVFLAGCFVIPAEPEPDPDPIPIPDIVCAGGRYEVHYEEWSNTGCGEVYALGTYWVNEDGRVFLISEETPYDPDSNTEAQDAFGECPAEFIEEVLF